MNTAGSFTDVFVRSAISSPKMTNRTNANLAKICDYTILSLKKGLTKEEKLAFITKLDSLHDKTFHFGFFVSAGNDDVLHASFAILDGHNFWGRLGNVFKKIFSLPKERRRLNDQAFLEDVTLNELLDLVELSIENGLNSRKLHDMKRTGMDAYCTVIEIQLQQAEDESYSLAFFYF